MKRYFYDLHIHSALSPCGDDESTPASIAGMAKLNGLDIVALTDHNTCKNCPAFFEAAKKIGVFAVAGMEVTTAEEIHAVCLFPTLDKALEFENELNLHRLLFPNRKDIFGNQYIMDCEDNIIGEEEYLLSAATDISLADLPKMVENYGGICYPAHIDRASNSVIAVLGCFPTDEGFTCAEVHDGNRVEEFLPLTKLNLEKLIISSDAHYLWDIKEAKEYLELPEIPEGAENAGEYLINYLRG